MIFFHIPLFVILYMLFLLSLLPIETRKPLLSNLKPWLCISHLTRSISIRITIPIRLINFYGRPKTQQKEIPLLDWKGSLLTNRAQEITDAKFIPSSSVQILAHQSRKGLQPLLFISHIHPIPVPFTCRFRSTVDWKMLLAT